jgi:uncharacterized protein (TIGR03435 family)
LGDVDWKTESMLSLTRLLLSSTLVATCAVSAAQNPADGPSFEVASVKPNKSGALTGRAPSPEVDRVRAVNTPLRTLVQVAYNIGVDRLVGVPEWIVRERFDIEAKADAPLTGNTWQLMLRTLLADRFKLLVHTETRDVPVFALVMARADRRPGPRLRPAAVDCATLRTRSEQTGDVDPCGAISRAQSLVKGMMTVRGAPLNWLIGTISSDTQRQVIDQTGLTGAFDWELTWTPQPFLGQPNDGRFPTIDREGPSIYTAIQEQLGLKVESRRGPVDFLVIDHVERPTPD